MATREEETANLEKYNKELEKLNKLQQEGNKLSEEQKKRKEELIIIINSLNEKLQTTQQEYQRQVDVLKQLGEVTQANIVEINRKIAAELENIKTLKEAGTLTVQDEAAIRKRIAALEDQKDSINNVARATEDFITTTTGIDDRWKNTLIGSILSGDPKKNLQTFAEKAKKQLSVENILGSLAMKIQEVGVAILMLSKEQMSLADNTVSSFYAATGATEAYTESIYAVARGNTAMGIGFAESGKAMTALYDGLNTFTNLSKSSQQELAVTTAKLEKLGISGADTAKSIATLSQMMNVSETQAAKTVEEFAAMGQAIGVSSKQMIADFAGVKDQLGVFGNEMNKVFTDLAAQSKATGVAVSDLLNLANKFDTFSSAADSVGKLNAMLGGPYLSAMAMIEATDPTERIDMLRQAVNNAGVAFEDLSYYEKKAIMEAGGFKSAEEAQRVLSMSAGAYANELEKQTAAQEELNDAIQRAQPISDKLSLIMANFAIIIEPLVTGLSKFLSFILEIQDVIPGFGTGLILIIGFFGLMIASLPILISLAGSLATIFTALTPAAASTAPAVEAAAAGVVSASTALSAATPAIAAASTGLAILAAVLLAVGVAALMVGVAMALVIYSIALLVKEGIKAPEIFLNMAAGLLALALAVTAFSNPLIVFGMAKMIASVYGLALAINSLESDKVLNFRIMMEKIVEVSEPDTAAQFTQFKQDFEAVAKATAELDITRMSVFSNMLNATQNLSQNLQLKQDIKVMIDSQEIKARIMKDQGRSPLQGN